MIRNISKCCHQCFNPALLLTLKISSPASLIHTFTKTLAPASKLDLALNKVDEPQWRSEESAGRKDTLIQREESAVQISHPWPEWVNLMECLLKRGHLDDADGNALRNGELGAKESNIIRTACLNFGRDQYQLLRFLCRKDIGVTVALGCPSLDRKVVNSGKRLRAYVGIEEGNVCSSCNLRGDCDRAFVKAREDEGGRTVDVMRIILTYGLDPIIGSVENKPCLNKKVKESVRRLLKALVEHSTEEENSNLPDNTKVVIEQVHPNLQDNSKIDIPVKQGDWLCPKCNFINFARNIKCLRCDGLFEERMRKLQENNDHLPLKKGDWICNKCNFLNFAKNTRCLQCKEKPPKRHLNPGEWECDSCNYINFRRNMVCLKCDHRRPRASNASNPSLQPQPEDKDHRKNSKMTFVQRQGNDQSWMEAERKNRSRDSHMWRFVEDRVENHSCLSTWNDASQFINFPIAGGKTDLSRDAQKREAWKNEMIKSSEGCAGVSESDDELWSTDYQSGKETSFFTDDEEMAEWFGNGKNESRVGKSG